VPPTALSRRRARILWGPLLALATVLPAVVTVSARAASEPSLVPADVETTPVRKSGDAADDPAIWVNRSDPTKSTVIGNSKGDALEVYDLSGARIQRIDGSFGNVDVRQDVPLGTGSIDIAAVTGGGGLKIYAINPSSRLLSNISEGGTIRTGGGEGLCMYHSPGSGRFFVFQVTIEGKVTQTELGDADGDGLVDGQVVRTFDLGSEGEGCVADDGTGSLYMSQEDVALWRYGAEPGDGNTRTSIDKVGAGRLTSDLEGVTLVYGADGAGYLIVSDQNVARPLENFYAVYQRQAPNAFLGSFRITAGTAADGCSRTDGIDAVAAPLGSKFPSGMFVCQDDTNTAPGSAGHQSFKFTRLDRVLGALGSVPPPPPPPPPPGTGGTLVFPATADARVASATPNTNYGQSTTLLADASPRATTYLRFDVGGVPGRVTHATLRLWAVDGSGDGPEIYRADNRWDETGVTWNSQPDPIPGRVADIGKVSAGAWAQWDVTSAVGDNGTITFKVAADSSDGTQVRSSKAASRQPELVVEFDG
jgi:myo-inositol-hexaphosphate 3-phosphohydrolase